MEEISVVQTLNNCFKTKQGVIRALRFNADGNYCITCGSDKSLALWNPYTAFMLRSFSGHGYQVLDACASCDSELICSGGEDTTVFLWDVSTGKAKRRFKGHLASVNCVKFNEISNVVLSASRDGSVRLWDCRSHSREPIQILSDAKDSVTSLDVSASEIVTGSADEKVRRYDLRSGHMFEDTIGATVSCVSLTRDGQCCLVGSMDAVLRLFDKDNGECLSEYSKHQNTTYKLDSCLSHRDTHVITGSEDGFIYVYNLVHPEKVNRLECKSGQVVHSISHHPSDSYLLAAVGGAVYLWGSESNIT